MERLVIVGVVVVIAAVVALVVQRRQPPAEPAPTSGYAAPDQVFRADFDRPDAAWLVAVFTSATCGSCQAMWEKARHLESSVVAVQEVEVGAAKALHDRYRIDAVPITIIADADGVVRSRFIGPATATGLWAAVAELREPGSVPDECESHGEG